MYIAISNSIGASSRAGGLSVNEAFEFTVQTDNAGTSASNQFTIPITSSTPYNISTSDGQSITGATGATTLTFPSPGTYNIKITESCVGWRFKYAGDRLKMLNISNWGVFHMTQTEAFHGAQNMTCTAVDAPIYPPTNFYYAFRYCNRFNGAIGNWDMSNVTNMQGAFYGATDFNQDLTNWNTSNVTNMREMFYFTSFNGDVSNWDVTNLSGGGSYRLFGRTGFNGDLSNWDVSNWTSMTYVFEHCPFNNDSIANWDVSNVTTMRGLFNSNTQFNQDISGWDTSSVTDMRFMFTSASSFNQPIGSWNTSNVTLMDQMFYNADSFNQDLSGWDVSNVTNMNSMFQDRGNNPESNLNISGWTTTSLTQTVAMFKGTAGNTQDLSSWYMDNVTSINEMFSYGRINFNPSGWNLTPTTMFNAFLYPASVAGNIDTWNFSGWDITNLAQSQNFMNGLTLATANYDATLVAWEAQLQTAYPGGVGYTPINSISFGASRYSLGSAAETARTSLVNTFGWTITDGGGIAVPFTITVDTTLGDGLDQFTIPTTGGGYNYDVVTSDGQTITGNTGNTTITFPAAGTYDIEITGDFPRIYFNNGGDRLKLTDVKKWGSIAWNHMEDAFHGCNNLTVSATDAPNLSGVTNMDSMFARCTVFNTNINHWNVSTITDMGSLFYDCLAFNQPLDNWDVSNVTDFNGMFRGVTGTTIFNQDISGWDTSSATNLGWMFGKSQFNQPIGNWDVSNVTYFGYIFSGSFSFNQPLNNWDVTGATSLSAMFHEARVFNQDLDLWDTSGVTNMAKMFENATQFNGNISTWNTSNVTTMESLFNMWWGGTRPFNQNLNSWDVSNVTNFNGTFGYCINYNQPLDNWDTSSATNMQGMFIGNTSFNQDISGWNVSNVTRMHTMFERATVFNQDISGWDVSNVTTFQRFMNNQGVAKSAFNQNISGWNTSSATDFSLAFWNTSLNSSFSGWDIDQVTNFNNFKTIGDPLSTANYDATLVSWEAQLQAAYPGGVGYTPVISINFSSSQYTLGGEVEAARTSLINTFGWTITDGGGVAEVAFEYTFFPFGGSNAHTITTDPAYTYNYNVSVSTGETYTNQTGDLTIFFPDKTTLRTMTITGVFPALQAATNGTQTGVREIISFGSNLWRKMSRMFKGMSGLTAMPVTPPNLNLCTTFYETFHSTNIPVNNYIGTWDVSDVIDMHGAFRSCNISNLDITNWDVSNVTAFLRMFAVGSGFGTTLTDMTGWDTGNGTNFQEMFSYQTDFNQDISGWNMSSATNIQSMFYSTSGNLIFNQPIGNWDTSSLTNISGALRGCGLFDQDLSNWNISNLTPQGTLFLEFGGLSRANYDATLIGWANNPSSNINIHFGTSQYTLGGAAEAARNTLVNTYNWTITDGGGVNPNFEFTVNTSVTGAGSSPFGSFKLPLVSTSTVNATVDWGDGTVNTVTAYDDPNATHVYASSGNYNISISGVLNGWSFNSTGDKRKMVNISNWGCFDWTEPVYVFNGCDLMTQTATDAPTISTTGMVWAFGNTNNWNGVVDNWDMSGVTNITAMFRAARAFNQPVNSWNTSNFVNTSFAFFDADIFNQPLNNWDMSNVTAGQQMFSGADLFNQDLSSWDISSVLSNNFQGFLTRASSFNSPLNWSVINFGSVYQFLLEATSFDQILASWDISTIGSGTNSFMTGGGFVTPANYDATLVGWEAQAPPINNTWDFGSSQYTIGSAGETARTSLINTYGWTIIDGGGVNPAIPYTTDLVASYNFDADFSDYTGNHPLTPSGGTPPVAGVAGGVVSDCAEFNSTADYTLTADSNDFSFTDGVNDLPFSVSFWANFTSYDSSTFGGAWFLSKRDASTNEEYQILVFQNVFYVNLFSGGGSANDLNASLTYTPPIGSWHHYTVTYDGSATFAGIKLYIDGVSQTLTDNSSGTYVGMINGTQDINIGSRSWQPTAGSFWGKLDEMHIWKNRELTSAEVLDIYNTENAGNSIL